MAACPTGKVQFRALKAVRTALRRCVRSKRDNRHEQSFYVCEHCSAYHLTSNEPGDGKRFT